MIPISTKEKARLSPTVPEGAPAPVYLVRVPSWRDREAWHAELTGLGATPPTGRQMRKLIRQGAIELQMGSADLVASACDELDAAEDEVRAASPDAIKAILEVQEILGKVYEPYQRGAQLQSLYNRLSVGLAFQMFVVGSAGDLEPRDIRLVGGRVADDCMIKIPPVELREIGGKIIGLMYPSQDVAKNSDSPSPSAPSPTDIAAASSPRTEAPAGSPSAKGRSSTKPTLNS